MTTTSPATALVQDFSMEMTGKDIPKLEEARASIPRGTRINVTFLGNEDLEMRLAASKAVKDFGFVPVPHISARRLHSREMLEEFLGALQRNGTIENVFVVGGDPATPEGPYEDSVDVIRSGVLQKYGVTNVGITGYPEGHPEIESAKLWAALEAKNALLTRQKLDGVIITQFGFDVDAVLDWVVEVRARGISLPIRIGVPGPAGIKRLVTYASRFGVSTSAGIAKKYGFSITDLLGTAGPDRFVTELGARYDERALGELKLHFYTFGGMKATSDWIDAYAKEH